MFVKKQHGEASPIADELFRLHEAMDWIYYLTNQERFLLAALTGLNFFERHGHAAGLAIQYMCVGLICDVVPAFRVAEHYHRRAVALAERTGHPIAVGVAYLGIAMHEFSLGHLGPALENYQTAAAAFREAGHLRGWGAATQLIGWIFLLRGDVTTASEKAQELIRLGQEASDRQIWVWGLHTRGMVERCTGALGVSDLQAAIDLCRSIPDYAGLVQSSALLGACHLRRGELGPAMHVLEEANQIMADPRLRGITVTWSPMVWAEACIRAIDAAEAGQKAAARKRAKRASQEAMRHAKTVRYQLPMALRLRGILEWQQNRRTAAERSWRASVAVAEELGEPYELALTCLEVGRRTGRQAELERAETIFRQVGAVLDMTEAQRLGSCRPAEARV
jgi:tetratricopeptide (TPR) repeat protein